MLDLLKSKKKIVTPVALAFTAATPIKIKLKKAVQQKFDVWFQQTSYRLSTGLLPNRNSMSQGYTESNVYYAKHDRVADSDEIKAHIQKEPNQDILNGVLKDYIALFDALENDENKDTVKFLKDKLYTSIDDNPDTVVERYGNFFMDVLGRAEIRNHSIWDRREIAPSDGGGGKQKRRRKSKAKKSRRKATKQRKNKKRKTRRRSS